VGDFEVAIRVRILKVTAAVLAFFMAIPLSLKNNALEY
jgi:hypothetical protein